MVNSLKNFLYHGFLLFFLVGLLYAPATYAQPDEPSGLNSQFYYSGRLGTLDKIEMNMQVNGYNVSGSFMTTSTGDIFVFKGRLAADKSGIGVVVYDEKDTFIASVEARVISKELDFAREIKGTWKPVDGSPRKNLTLNKVAEFAAAIDRSETSYFD